MNRSVGRICQISRGLFTKKAVSPVSRAYSSEAKLSWLEEVEAEQEHAKRSSEFWKKVTYYVGGPALVLSSLNAYYIYKKHKEHAEHHHDPEIDVPYTFENLRFKKYPWGDGTKTLFWNDNVNQIKGTD
ncbi:cytochrome c oxidase subunit VIa [Schizosaccharomyces cryophilus OY26]|uniref:Cytochrome c oxidase subunit n=1 Tax=Schizosaccharomyces cryophilus (strain OY26 / ATCC MYA-4695 / CBS 11777 / NBRC 106824 / NRRL Y48691) TaxID=653667 RepID=S9X259_SCHCR|nr:cytochrome c oxidase subunit VIa [Schizosaccharomyces cryophilus OY26]EPY51197.1 cytochrome c oxidase subunit VIa [Schizosaccharomyces cryophilus OY26]